MIRIRKRVAPNIMATTTLGELNFFFFFVTLWKNCGIWVTKSWRLGIGACPTKFGNKVSARAWRIEFERQGMVICGPQRPWFPRDDDDKGNLNMVFGTSPNKLLATKNIMRLVNFNKGISLKQKLLWKSRK